MGSYATTFERIGSEVYRVVCKNGMKYIVESAGRWLGNDHIKGWCVFRVPDQAVVGKLTIEKLMGDDCPEELSPVWLSQCPTIDDALVAAEADAMRGGA